MKPERALFYIRGLLIGFVVGLAVSGITAFPLPMEVRSLCETMGWKVGAHLDGVPGWILHVREGLDDVEAHHPFLFYGTDWLAFAHLVIALLFVGPIQDPVRNVWVLRWGVMACILVLPLALICGPIRGIPVAWQIIDCSFGVVGIVPLLVCLKLIRRLESNL